MAQPGDGKQIARADYRFTFYPERDVENQPAHFALMEHQVTMFTPLYQDSKDEWALAAKGLFQDIDTNARFPDTGGPFRASSGTSARRHQLPTQVRQLLDGWRGADWSRSASDKPFHSVDEMYFRVQ